MKKLVSGAIVCAATVGTLALGAAPASASCGDFAMTTWHADFIIMDGGNLIISLEPLADAPGWATTNVNHNAEAVTSCVHL